MQKMYKNKMQVNPASHATKQSHKRDLHGPGKEGVFTLHNSSVMKYSLLLYTVTVHKDPLTLASHPIPSHPYSGTNTTQPIVQSRYCSNSHAHTHSSLISLARLEN